MQKTKIEWCDYTWNPVVGCGNHCPYCYARKIALRFAGTGKFPKGFHPHFFEERLTEPYKLKKPSRIFVCSMGELFGHWVPGWWIEQVLGVARALPRHTFIFLTKYPGRLRECDFPCNAWVGVTVNYPYKETGRVYDLVEGCNACVKFVSFEPLFQNPDGNLYGYPWTELNWVIVGAQTGPYKPPRRGWVEEIVNFGRAYGIPVFLKDNLFRGIPDLPKIQEFPERKFLEKGDGQCREK